MHKNNFQKDVFKLELGTLMSVVLGKAYEWLRNPVLQMASCRACVLLGKVLQLLGMLVLEMALRRAWFDLEVVNSSKDYLRGNAFLWQTRLGRV